MPTIPTQPFTPVTGVAIDVDPAAALAKGLAVATGDDAARREGVIPQDEADSVRKWYDCFEEARKFDDSARRQMAVDRRYARGDSSFLVDANILGTNIEILESHLFARNPDFEINPGKAMQPPSAEAIRDAVRPSSRRTARWRRPGRWRCRRRSGWAWARPRRRRSPSRPRPR